ncbi:sensor histidine kinase [Amycolatopsis sp. 195334CR]|uniref:sensor histidine kinase n=1 Tax=Amycolatopsis sp. 195334CR TaxID=2814588 RepID=UPI001A8EEEDD|nr:histidine kinase [Amycolatopsis sp. 195334CR]MBN6040382.1 sensor histidine kinase [Amycolatopsis sp. 195334CR]
MTPLLVTIGAITVALEARSWTDVVVLGLGLAAALVTFERWTVNDVFRVAIPCLLVSAGVWVYGALVIGAGTAFLSISLVGPHIIPQLARRRGFAATALVTFVAAVGVTKLVLTGGELPVALITWLFLPTGITAMVTGLMFPNRGFYGMVKDLEEARDREAELAVVRERMRFASDLHDIQGHTLHVVKLKITLAQKLVRTNAERADAELREIHALVADTIAQTKELAYAQRRLNLPAELENAKNLFEAAGIRVHVDREAEVDARASELLGQVLRETTTNILRHAQAEQVRITLSETGITILNDGAQAGPLPELSGLATLRERVASDGGELTTEQENGNFLTAATFPQMTR